MQILLSENANSVDAAIEGAQHDPEEYLPLGRAMHMLLHVKEHVFDQAISDIADHTRGDSPVMRALLSLESYLDSHDFTHVYEPLREKCLKRNTNTTSQHEHAIRIVRFFLLYSRHREKFYNAIFEELNGDKRQQLAVVVVLEYIVSKWQLNPVREHINLVSRLLPSLVRLSKWQPSTLLVCSAIDVALSCSRYAVTVDDIQHTSAGLGKSIILIETTFKDSEKERLSGIWSQMQDIFSCFQEWRIAADSIELAGWKGIYQLTTCAQLALQHDDSATYKAISLAWQLITSTLSSKLILAKKPLSSKRQKAVLIYQKESCDTFLVYAKLTLLATLQKGHWDELCSRDISLSKSQDIDDNEVVQSIEALFKVLFASFPFKTPYEYLGNNLIPRILISSPIREQAQVPPEVLSLILSLLNETDAVTKWEEQVFQQYMIKQPRVVIPMLLKYMDDAHDNGSFHVGMLNDWVSYAATTDDPFLLIDPIVEDLLEIVGRNNTACEILVKCMPYICLPDLLLRLMRMAFTVDMRTNHVCRALIAKALLVEKWASTGVLLYIDLVRDFKERESFEVQTKGHSILSNATPGDIFAVTKGKNKSELLLDGPQLTKHVSELLSSLDLWGRKADLISLEETIGQFVQKTYGMPGDLTYIHAWKVLAGTMIQNESLIWVVIRQCLQIMTEQPKNENSPNNQSLTFCRLSPMLILQTIPTEAYTRVSLLLSDINSMKPAWSILDIPVTMLKESNEVNSEHDKLVKELAEELFGRASLPDEYQQINELSRALIMKIFCKHPTILRSETLN